MPMKDLIYDGFDISTQGIYVTFGKETKFENSTTISWYINGHLWTYHMLPIPNQI